MKSLRDTLLALLTDLQEPRSYKQLATALGCTEQTAGTNIRKLIADDLVYVHHTKTADKGGCPEKFFMAGPEPEGYLPPNFGLSPEAIAASKLRRLEKNREHSRNAKAKKRRMLRMERAALKPLQPAISEEDKLFIPNRT